MNIAIFLTLILPSISFAETCPYPAEPINWIMRYCAFKIGTDDEVAIQKSECFKQAEKDLNNKDSCKTKEKYKKLFCESKATQSLKKCLNDNSIKPFVAGTTHHADKKKLITFKDCKSEKKERITWPFKKVHEPPTLPSNYIEVNIDKELEETCQILVYSYIEQAETPYICSVLKEKIQVEIKTSYENSKEFAKHLSTQGCKWTH